MCEICDNITVNKATVQQYDSTARIFYVYGLYRPDKEDSLFYVGKGCNGIMFEHRKESKLLLTAKRKKWLKTKVIHKLWNLGLDFEERIIRANLTEQAAFNLEKRLIKKYGRIDLKTGFLTNCTSGGDGYVGGIPWNKNTPRTKEEKDKIRATLLGTRWSDEINAKKGRKGRVSAMKGRHHSEETKKKISENGRGLIRPPRRPHTEEEKKNISEKLKGRKMSLEFCDKLSKRMKGNTYGLGTKRTEETKQKISISQKGIPKPLCSFKRSEETKKKMSAWQKGVSKPFPQRKTAV